MRQREKKWQRIVREQFTQHRQLEPDALKQELMGELKAASNQCEVHGHRIHWIEAGDGPPLVLVHGWTCSGFFWKPVIPRLEGSFRVLAPDLPGHGFSGKKETSYLPEEQAKRLLDWLSEIGVERFVLVGHSMGGEIAARMALGAPDRVEKLVLVGAIGLKRVKERLPWYMLLSLTPVARTIADRFVTERAMRSSHRVFMTGPGRPDYPECIRDVVLTNTNTPEDLAVLTHTTRDGLFRGFLDARITRLTMPVLCLWGTEDKLTPLEIGILYAKLIPHARLAEFPGTGHMLPWEEPDRMAEEILGFVKSLAKG